MAHVRAVAVDDGVIAGGSGPRWRTEQATQFYAKTPDRASGAGARTEQEIGGIR